MKTIKAECHDCGGTGLYKGFAEPEGHAVICASCGGTGCELIPYRLFGGRKEKKGIHTVTSVGAVGASISYYEFQAGRMP